MIKKIQFILWNIAIFGIWNNIIIKYYFISFKIIRKKDKWKCSFTISRLFSLVGRYKLMELFKFLIPK